MNGYYRNQRGQALLAMLAFIIVLAIAMVYLFNTSQLLSERAQAKVLADHAAYNTAVKQAQLLNANAYMNKAKIANQLAVAQAVSVASWAKHFEPIPQNSQILNGIPYVGPYVHQGVTVTSNMIQPLADLQSLYVPTNALATRYISTQQSALNYASLLDIKKSPELILDNSSIGKNFIATPLLSSVTTSAINPLSQNFLKRYEGNSIDPYAGRIRMKNVLLQAKDAFTNERRSDKKIDIPLLVFPIRNARIERRGGTEISQDLDQWKGVDTMSFHYEQFRCSWLRCGWRSYEKPIGYGSALARNNNNDNDYNNREKYDYVNINPAASRRSRQYKPSWDSRSNSGFNAQGEYGVPEYWDLSKDFLNQDKPTLEIAIKVSKNANQLDTTNGISNFKAGEEIDIKSKNSVSAVSTAQVYFERPLQDSQGNNTYLNSGKLEKASLFNPYWNVKLTDNSTQSIIEANVR